MFRHYGWNDDTNGFAFFFLGWNQQPTRNSEVETIPQACGAWRGQLGHLVHGDVFLRPSWLRESEDNDGGNHQTWPSDPGFLSNHPGGSWCYHCSSGRFTGPAKEVVEKKMPGGAVHESSALLVYIVYGCTCNTLVRRRSAVSQNCNDFCRLMEEYMSFCEKNVRFYCFLVSARKLCRFSANLHRFGFSWFSASSKTGKIVRRQFFPPFDFKTMFCPKQQKKCNRRMTQV